MAARDLPVRQDLLGGRHRPGALAPVRGENAMVHANGRFGAAVERPRDAYREVPILKRPTWGHEVAGYFFFGGISSGAYTLGSLAMLCDGSRWTKLGRRAHLVSLAALSPCPPLLIADLGRPARFHHMLRLFKPSSPMNLGAWALTVHGGFAGLTALVMLAQERQVPLLHAVLSRMPERVLAAGGIPSALLLGGYTGVLLGTTSIPVWSTSPLLGALFMASSLSTGLAALTIAEAIACQDEGATQAMLGDLGWKFGSVELALLGGFVGTSGQAAGPLLRGRHGAMLAGATALLGLAALAEVARARGRRSAWPSLIASAATLVSGALLRSAVVGAGGVSASDREGTLHATRRSNRAPGWGR